jgi:hypothetical protein
MLAGWSANGAEAWMEAQVSPDDPEIERRVIEFGQQGLTRAQIALRLGMNLVKLKAREESDPDFAWALRQASEARVDWWHEQARRQLVEHFDLDLYVMEYRWRFPGRPLPWEPDPPAEPPAPAPQPKRWRRGGFW